MQLHDPPCLHPPERHHLLLPTLSAMKCFRLTQHSALLEIQPAFFAAKQVCWCSLHVERMMTLLPKQPSRVRLNVDGENRTQKLLWNEAISSRKMKMWKSTGDCMWDLQHAQVQLPWCFSVCTLDQNINNCEFHQNLHPTQCPRSSTMNKSPWKP